MTTKKEVQVEKKELQDQLKKYLESQTSNDIKTLIAFTIRKTPTVKDDLILENIADVKDVLSDSIETIAKSQPTYRDAKKAGISLLKIIADATGSKWLKIAAKFFGTFV